MKSKNIFIKILIGTLMLTPTIVSVDSFNIVKAKEVSKSSVDEKIINEASIIRDYLSMTKKGNLYTFSFNYDSSLEKRLTKNGSAITVEQINSYIANLNEKLYQENGQGELNDVIKEIKYYYQLNKETNISSLRGRCGNTFTWVGLAHSTMYGLLVPGPAGVALSAFTGLTYAIASTITCP